MYLSCCFVHYFNQCYYCLCLYCAIAIRLPIDRLLLSDTIKKRKLKKKLLFLPILTDTLINTPSLHPQFTPSVYTRAGSVYSTDTGFPIESLVSVETPSS
jgi:hypothetical protein